MINERTRFKFIFEFINNYITRIENLNKNSSNEESIDELDFHYLDHPEMEFANAIMKTFSPEFYKVVGNILVSESESHTLDYDNHRMYSTSTDFIKS